MQIEVHLELDYSCATLDLGDYKKCQLISSTRTAEIFWDLTTCPTISVSLFFLLFQLLLDVYYNLCQRDSKRLIKELKSNRYFGRN